MELSNLRPANGAVKSRKRIARGQGSGHGGTATRGHKGDKARSGFKEKRHFEGGQTPMQRRVPKRGFKNINRIDYIPLNLEKLEELALQTGAAVLDVNTLIAIGFVRASDKVKLLGNGTLSTKLDVSVHAASASARAAVEALGGTVTLV